MEYQPDLETVMSRYEAWWDCQIVDRPLVSIHYARPPAEQRAFPRGQHATLRERWFDTDFLVQCANARMHNTIFAADALPVIYPNLGPEVFSAFYGCELDFGQHTSWSRPILHDWSEASVNALRLDWNNVYFRKIVEMTDALIEAGRNRFIVGYTDLHGGGDALAAFRDPQNLLFDTLEVPDRIKPLVERITGDFLQIYDFFHERLGRAGMPSTTWCPVTCRGKMHIPSNDFSCMISTESFVDLFIPGLVDECRHMDRCLYHLDGQQALRYLDLLLDIPEIHAIQWVPGAGRDYWADWIEVYQRIQARGKALQLPSIPVQDLPLLFDSLRPEGVWISGLGGIADADAANAALKQIAAWTGKQGKS